MENTKQFRVAGLDVESEAYHYRACGLDDVFLLNGFTREQTDYGSGVSVHNADELHCAIGLRLIMDCQPLNPREFRFLRKQMSLTQEELASRLKVNAQTVARYEKEETGIPGPTDGLMRMIYVLSLIPADKRQEILDEIMELLEEPAQAGEGVMYFERTNHGWSKGMPLN